MNQPAVTNSPIRVMIVDDHKTVLWGLEQLVESAQPKMTVVGTASTYDETVTAAVRVNPDVILLDVDLNGASSVALIPELRKKTTAKILVLTGGRELVTLQNAVMQGARGVIGKDESADLLLHAIECVHAGEIWLNRKIMGAMVDAMVRASDLPEDPDAEKIASLTARELEIVRAVVGSHGAKSIAIAEQLHISEHTLRNHLTQIYEKLGVRNRIDLFAFANEHKLS